MGKLFAQARDNASLAPAERALLKLIEGLACAALVAALPILSDALSQGSVAWGDVARTALAAGATAALVALLKYCKAFGDPPLPAQSSQPNQPTQP